MQRENIESLTGLRFVAAFYVFAFHITIRWPLFESDGLIKTLVSQGATGMSIFFILSGFLLAYRHADEGIDTRQYFINRFARIYPVYFVAALLTVPWMGLGLESTGLLELLTSLSKIVALVMANIFLVQAWYPDAFPLWNDSASWSISVEAFCYLMLPLMLPWMSRRSLAQLLVVFLCCYLLAVAPGQYVRFFPVERFAVVYAIPIFRLPEFLMGVCAALALRRGVRLVYPSITAAAMIMLFIFYVGLYGSYMPAYVGHNWAVLPIITVLIFSLVEARGVIGLLFSSRVFVWFGKISYCFYSFQVLVLFLLVQYHKEITDYFPLLSDSLAIGVFAFAVLLFFSVAGYYLIEEPCRKILVNRFSKKITREQAVLNSAPV